MRIKGNALYLFNKYSLSFYSVSGAVLDTEDTKANRQNPDLGELLF